MTISNDKKVFHVLGFDFDGCLLPEKMEIDDSILKQNSRLIAALKKQREAFCGRLVFLSSSRQSKAIDEGNRKHHTLTSNGDPTSCFIPMKTLAREVEGIHSPLLLSDVYDEKPEGYAYTRAIQLAEDVSAYHPGFVFDLKKTSIIYLQAHTAANHVRNCDLFELSGQIRPDLALLKLPFRSNAAYIYFSDQKTLFYVNKIENSVIPVEIKNQERLSSFLEQCRERIRYIEHDFESQQDEDIIRGITLSPQNIQALPSFLGHTHVVKDYPIVFDFFDDLDEILKTVDDILSPQAFLLPKNVLLRLNHYQAPPDSRIKNPTAVLYGMGEIDADPKTTIRNIAKVILGKTSFTDSDFHIERRDDPFSSFLSGEHPQFHTIFKKPGFFRRTSVKLSPDYALTKYYAYLLEPNFVIEILKYINDYPVRSRTDKFSLWATIAEHQRRSQVQQRLSVLLWATTLEELQSYSQLYSQEMKAPEFKHAPQAAKDLISKINAHYHPSVSSTLNSGSS